jgi:hypothetical protein
MSRRHAPVLTLLAAVVMLFMSACGSLALETPTQAPATQKLVIAAMADPAISPMRNMVIEGLAEKQLGLNVEWVDLPYETRLL